MNTAPQAPGLSRGGASQSERDASRTKLASSIGQVCLSPNEKRVMRDIKAAGQYISPSRLHRIYEQVTEQMDTDFDFGPAIITYLRRHGSIPVDQQVGERAAARIDRRRHR